MKNIVISVIGNATRKFPGNKTSDLTLISPRDFFLLQYRRLAAGIVMRREEIEPAVTEAMEYLNAPGSIHVFMAVDKSQAKRLWLSITDAIRGKKVNLVYLKKDGIPTQKSMYVISMQVLMFYLTHVDPEDQRLTTKLNISVVKACVAMYGHIMPLAPSVVEMPSA